MKKGKYKKVRYFEGFGKFLQNARLEADLTQLAVSKLLGYASPQFISNFERGIALPPLVKLRKLMRVYKLNPDTVIDQLIEARRLRLARELKNK